MQGIQLGSDGRPEMIGVWSGVATVEVDLGGLELFTGSYQQNVVLNRIWSGEKAGEPIRTASSFPT